MTVNNRFGIAIALIAASVVVLLSLVRNIPERRRRRLYTERLATCLSPRALERLVQAGGPSIDSAGTRTDRVTALLAQVERSDIHRMNECIHLSDGTLAEPFSDDFIAFWNVPVRQENHAARACAAALRWRKRRGNPIRIGIHTGMAQIEIRAVERRLGFAPTGDAVDIGRFLLALNERLGTDILISSSTRKATDDKFVTRRLGDFKVPGRDKALTVHELIAPKADEEASRTLRDEFAYALQLFQNGDFVHACLSFERLVEQFPDDKPTQFYIAKVAKLQANPVEGEWDGVVDADEA